MFWTEVVSGQARAQVDRLSNKSWLLMEEEYCQGITLSMVR
jgi:hypothetical protein